MGVVSTLLLECYYNVMTMNILLWMNLISTPTWVDQTPLSSEFVYTVGEGESSSKDEALQKAWTSALIRFALSEFPELNQLKARSVETLKGSEFERTSIQNFQLIQWRGIHEVKSNNSPTLIFDSSSKTYHVFRLLRWSIEEVKRVHEEIRLSLQKVKQGDPVPTYKIPMTSEEAQRAEKEIESQLEIIQRHNQKLLSRNEYIERVMERVVCGTTVGDLWKLLGKPDHRTYTASSWGRFSIQTIENSENERVIAISRRGEFFGYADEIQPCERK